MRHLLRHFMLLLGCLMLAATPLEASSIDRHGPNNRHPGSHRPAPGAHRPQPGPPSRPPRPQPPRPQPPRPQPPRPQPPRPQPPRPVRPNYGYVPAPPRPWHRPVPPHHWRPAPGLPTVGTILGFALGTAIDASLAHLMADNVSIVGYDNSVIAVQNVAMMNQIWPEGRLVYTNGLLTGSQFYDVSPYCDVARYNRLYNEICRTYGAPVVYNPSSVGGDATWYGRNGGFINLIFEPVFTSGGLLTYRTILSIGN